MYRFSRALYRELAPALQPGPGDPDGSGARREVLEACEEVVERLAVDLDFARPARSLFQSVRRHVPVQRQEWAWRLIETYVQLMLEQRRRIEAEHQPRLCEAVSRRGRPCQRGAIAGNRYCPSHRHLEHLEAPEPALS